MLRSIRVPKAFSPGAGPVGCTAPVPGVHYTYNIGHIGLKKSRKYHRIRPGNEGCHTILVPSTIGPDNSVQQNGTFAVTGANGTDWSARFRIGAGQYEVYAHGPGKPGKQVIITPTATYEDTVAIDTREPGPGSVQPGYRQKPGREKITGLFPVTVTSGTRWPAG